MVKYKNCLSEFKKIIENTIISIQKYKMYDLFGVNEINICINNLEELLIDLKNVKTNIGFEKLKKDLANVLKMFGTLNISDLFYGTSIKINTNKNKYLTISKYVRPIGYKTIDNNLKDTIKELGLDNKNDLDCILCDSNSFQNKIYGIKIYFQNKESNTIILIYGIVDDIPASLCNDNYINNKFNELLNIKKLQYFNDNIFEMYINSLNIKDLLIKNNSDIIDNYKQICSLYNELIKKNLLNLIKEFNKKDLHLQRDIIIILLLNEESKKSQYLAYLLYDLLSSDLSENIDTPEQTLLFDSLPWCIKKQFKIAMKNTMDYTNKLYNLDENNIPLEQQICLLPTNESVKEKAMQKLTEVKAKADDSGIKARQYLDGLLKIPFNIYKEELILLLTEKIKKLYFDVFNKKTTINQIKYELSLINDDYFYNKQSNILKEALIYNNRSNLIELIKTLNKQLKNHNIKKLSYSKKKIDEMKCILNDFFNKYKKHSIMKDIINNYSINLIDANILFKNSLKIKSYIEKQESMILNVRENLNNALYGHEDAKRQIERIIAQWINGDNKGYCFGFEGPPGVGKTTFAKKGLSKCLLDENNESRPFSYIAIGGSTNGSTLDGHNYTYVGSTWGRIVDIVIEHKCLNPIIFIDELDKVSKTESGREIISILTHLTDPTQNSTFQDKYFSGIDIDMSRVLFIFSYNDVSQIDKILLDRIHRIQFKPLLLQEKIVIVNKYILPELYKKMGLENCLVISDEIIKYIIEFYTNESGVRKLKELLFEIVGEINLRILRKELELNEKYNITLDDVKKDYLKKNTQINLLEINTIPKVGVINGLWASSFSGGILQIESKFYLSETLFDLKLTGLQGDVMKESMNVSKTLAWDLIDDERKQILLKNFNESKMKGIHIHCPEGAVHKDGPSAGAAITILIYSLLTNRKIKNDVAITGEINMQGKITKIGGLDLKIMGGIKANVSEFIIPNENKFDFDLIHDKMCNELVGINFYFVDTIQQALELLLK